MGFETKYPKLSMTGSGWPLIVVDPFSYRPPSEVWEAVITVPVGTETDLASVPRFFWRIFPPFGKYSQAAIIHDYLYNVPMDGMTRKVADTIFLSAMVELGVGRIKRALIHRAVRVGGWRPWNRVRKESK